MLKFNTLNFTLPRLSLRTCKAIATIDSIRHRDSWCLAIMHTAQQTAWLTYLKAIAASDGILTCNFCLRHHRKFRLMFSSQSKWRKCDVWRYSWRERPASMHSPQPRPLSVCRTQGAGAFLACGLRSHFRPSPSNSRLWGVVALHSAQTRRWRNSYTKTTVSRRAWACPAPWTAKLRGRARDVDALKTNHNTEMRHQVKPKTAGRGSVLYCNPVTCASVASRNMQPLHTGFATHKFWFARLSLNFQQLFAIKGLEHGIEIRITFVGLIELALHRLIKVLDCL